MKPARGLSAAEKAAIAVPVVVAIVAPIEVAAAVGIEVVAATVVTIDFDQQQPD
jgi:hypothetical protein